MKIAAQGDEVRRIIDADQFVLPEHVHAVVLEPVQPRGQAKVGALDRGRVSRHPVGNAPGPSKKQPLEERLTERTEALLKIQMSPSASGVALSWRETAMVMTAFSA